MTIFALSIKKDWRHRGERLSLGKKAHTLCESITKDQINEKNKLVYSLW